MTTPIFSSRHIESSFYSLLLNCGFFNSCLNRLGFVLNASCRLCDDYDDANHIVFYCNCLDNVDRERIIGALSSLNLDIDVHNLVHIIQINDDIVHNIDNHLQFILNVRPEL